MVDFETNLNGDPSRCAESLFHGCRHFYKNRYVEIQFDDLPRNSHDVTSMGDNFICRVKKMRRFWLSWSEIKGPLISSLPSLVM